MPDSMLGSSSAEAHRISSPKGYTQGSTPSSYSTYLTNSPKAPTARRLVLCATTVESSPERISFIPKPVRLECLMAARGTPLLARGEVQSRYGNATIAPLHLNPGGCLGAIGSVVIETSPPADSV